MDNSDFYILVCGAGMVAEFVEEEFGNPKVKIHLHENNEIGVECESIGSFVYPWNKKMKKNLAAQELDNLVSKKYPEDLVPLLPQIKILLEKIVESEINID